MRLNIQKNDWVKDKMWSQLTDGRNHGELIGPFVEIFPMAIGYPVCLVPLIGVNSKTMMKYAIKTTITQLIQKVAEYGSKLFPSEYVRKKHSTFIEYESYLYKYIAHPLLVAVVMIKYD